MFDHEYIKSTVCIHQQNGTVFALLGMSKVVLELKNKTIQRTCMLSTDLQKVKLLHFFKNILYIMYIDH